MGLLESGTQVLFTEIGICEIGGFFSPFIYVFISYYFVNVSRFRFNSSLLACSVILVLGVECSDSSLTCNTQFILYG